MKIVELRDLEEARTYVAQGLHFARSRRPHPDRVKLVLETALSICAGGEPLPPLGFLADFAHVLVGDHSSGPEKQHPAVNGWPADRARRYEDFVLGKLTADWTVERASDALRRYSPAERPRGLAYAVKQLRERGRIGGTDLSPAVVRSLLSGSPDEVLRIGEASLAESGPLPLLLEQYEDLVAAFRRLPELLGPEDLVALEQKTALADLGQYVAHRQILRTVALLESRLPGRPPPPRPGRTEVPTRVADEDVYPVGGYSSIGTKGSVESLLHSQLAYFDDGPQPDLFTVKFVRDELFYYTRDENQFLRRKRAFAIVLDPSLVSARVKDPDAPVQRIVFAVAAVVAVVGKLIEWLTTDALRIELLVPTKDGKNPLADETELLTILLRDAVERGAVAIEAIPHDAMMGRFDTLARMHQFHSLAISTDAIPTFEAAAKLLIAGPKPEWTDTAGDRHAWPDEDVSTAWAGAVLALLREWV